MSGSSALSDDSTNQVIVTPKALHDFCVRCMESVGARADHADVWAELLVSADTRGHYSHGMNRLDYYLNDVRVGNTAVNTEPKIVKETVATALVNGNNALGPVIGKFCMDLAIEKAKTAGIGWVSASNSNHFGIAGWYSMRAMEQGMIGLAFCNTSPCVVPTRGKTNIVGANPIACAAKGENGETFELDMAVSTVALGKLEIKHRLGQQIPYSWGVDRNGKMSTDTEEVLMHGGLCPLGGAEETSGYKGYGLAMMVELFCGILSGSSFGSNIRRWTPETHTGQADLGLCFVAIDPHAFAPGFASRLSELMEQCRTCPPADGEDQVLVPGDPEKIHIELCEKLGGIPYHPKQVAFADFVAQKYGVEPLERKS